MYAFLYPPIDNDYHYHSQLGQMRMRIIRRLSEKYCQRFLPCKSQGVGAANNGESKCRGDFENV